MAISLSRRFMILLLPLAATAQAPPAPLAFEVASIKPAGPPVSGSGTRGTPTGLNFPRATLRYCIGYAYRVKDYQISGPSWLDQLEFNLIAKAPEKSSPAEIGEMLQTLLAQRFHLRIHRETRDIQGLALVLAKDGLKIPERTAHGPGSGTTWPVTSDGQVSSNIDARSIPTPGAVRTLRLPDGGMRLVAGDIGMSVVAGNLGLMLGAPVFDLTGTTGTYDVVIDASRDDARNQTAIRRDGGDWPPSPEELAVPLGTSIFKSLEKLGLKLESRKVPQEIIVVDSADKSPTEN